MDVNLNYEKKKEWLFMLLKIVSLLPILVNLYFNFFKKCVISLYDIVFCSK